MTLRSHRVLWISILCATLSLADPPAHPAWWSEGNPPVIDDEAEPNNKGPATIGQAKHMVKSALEALEPILPDTAASIEADLATVIDLSIPDPKTPEWIEKQKAPLLIGQLKAIAHPFYEHLHTVAPTWLEAERITNGTNHPNAIFPWTTETTDDQNKAIANIGQLKAVFALRFEQLEGSALDSDGDGLPNNWEIAHDLDPYGQDNYLGIFKGGPFNNGQAFEMGVQAHPNASIEDLDGDGVSNEQDSRPEDHSFGVLAISISTPSHGTTLP